MCGSGVGAGDGICLSVWQKTVAELEAKRGVAGYQVKRSAAHPTRAGRQPAVMGVCVCVQTTERSLEEISAHKAQVDKSKGTPRRESNPAS